MRHKAVALATMGFRVFKLSASGRPIKAGWIESATADPMAVEMQWTDPAGESCDELVAICCGDGVLVLDADVKNGKTGPATLAALDLPQTLMAGTPSGGTHSFYRVPPGVYCPCSVEKLGPGLDVRGDRGYVVGVGSVRHGKPYAWLNDLPIADAPQALIDLVQGDRAATERNAVPVSPVDEQHTIERALAHLEHAEPAVEGAGGRALTIEIANRLMDWGLTPYVAAEVMAERWADECSPPWAPDLLTDFVDSLSRSRQSPIGSEYRSSPTAAFDVIPNAPTMARFRRITELVATPLPPRDWIVENFLARGFVGALIAQGGVGKTSFVCALALSLATGNGAHCGLGVSKQNVVWYVNNEDDEVELDRRMKAVAVLNGIADADYLDAAGQSNLIVDSGVGHPLMLAVKRGDVLAEGPEVAEMIATIKQHDVAVLILDPLIEFHEGEENDNREMKRVWSIARKIAVEAQCAVLVPAHDRKPSSSSDAPAGDMNSLRGASSQGGVVRMMFTLQNMGEKDAKHYGIGDDRRHLYVRLDDAKANLSLKGPEPAWFKRKGVDIGGEEIGALAPHGLVRKVERKADIVLAFSDALKVDEWRNLRDLIRSFGEAVGNTFGDEAHWARNVKAAFMLAGAVEEEDGNLSISVEGATLRFISMKGRGGIRIAKCST